VNWTRRESCVLGVAETMIIAMPPHVCTGDDWIIASNNLMKLNVLLLVVTQTWKKTPGS
jgi:hypothetical protein